MAAPQFSKYQGQSSLLSKQLLAFYRRVSQSTLTVVDVETTGSVAYKSNVIEVSVIKANLSDGILQQETSLINPTGKVPPFITKITGITTAMVSKAPYPEDVWADYESLLRQDVLTAHNLDFDYGFLKSEYKRLDVNYHRPPSHRFCTVLLSRLMLADLPSRSLPNLVKHFNFNVGTSHRAEADTKACWLLAEILLNRIQQDPEEKILGLFRQQWIRLQDAAVMFEKRKKDTLDLLIKAGLEHRLSKRQQQPLFRRGDVEDVFYAQQGEQLSVLP
ncbi:MAG: 3'-5' exonuclease [Leptolyngbyaceae cyanobacterium MAG.088]|nr:3'-5' exonuclease [Leptolyngbyaceae cyanobacterium MAG.088]